MEIKEVTISFGCTINLGNYENMRQDVHVRAEITQEEIDDGGLDELATMARKELAYSLHDIAEAALRRCKRWDEPDEDGYSRFNEERAERESNEFRWILKLHPDMAKDLLAEVVGDFFEAKRVEEVLMASPLVGDPERGDDDEEASDMDDFDDDDLEDEDDEDFDGEDIRTLQPSDGDLPESADKISVPTDVKDDEGYGEATSAPVGDVAF